MPRMSSRTMSLACLSEARSTIRRARRSASALSGAGLGSRTISEWLSMPATIAPSLFLDSVEFVKSSDSLLASSLECQSRGGRIQERRANRLVHGQFLLALPPCNGAKKNFANFATHVAHSRHEQVASLAERPRARVDVHASARNQFARQLAGRGCEGTHGVDMCTRLHGRVHHNGSWTRGAGGNNVCCRHLLCRSSLYGQPGGPRGPLAKSAGLLRRGPVDKDAFQVAHPPNGFDVKARLDARTEHSQAVGRRRGKRASGDRRTCCRANARQVTTIHDRQRRPGFVLAQDVD